MRQAIIDLRILKEKNESNQNIRKAQNISRSSFKPNGHNINSVSELYNKLQKAIVEVQANKKQYDAAYRSIILLKKNYQAEMNRLLTVTSISISKFDTETINETTIFAV